MKKFLIGFLVLSFAVLGVSIAQAAVTINATTVSSDVALTLTGAAASTWSLSTGALTINSGTAAALTIDSGTTGAIDIGTAANAKTITIGNGTGATSVVINAGTGALNIGTNAFARAITIGNETGTSSLELDSGTGALNIGNAIAKTITIGNATGATAVNVDTGTAGMAHTSTATTAGAFRFTTTTLTTGNAASITATNTAVADTAAGITPVLIAVTNAQGTAAQTLGGGFSGLRVNFTNAPTIAANTENMVMIQNQVTTNATDNAVATGLLIDNADTSATGSTVITDALRITNSGAIAGGITNAINIASTTITTDIVLQNAESIDNDTNGTILLTAPTTSLSGDLTITGGDINASGEASTFSIIDNTASAFILEDVTGGLDYILITTTDGSETITLGHSTVDSVTVTTDGTGTAEVALPAGSIDSTEILDATVASVDMSAGAKTNTIIIPVPDPGGADADISAGYVLWTPSVAVTITKVYTAAETAWVAAAAANDATVTVTNAAVGTVASLNIVTALGVGTNTDMGAITNGAVVAGTNVTITVTANGTANAPRQNIQIEYTTTN